MTTLHSSISNECVKIGTLLQNLFTLTSESEEANYFILNKFKKGKKKKKKEYYVFN